MGDFCSICQKYENGQKFLSKRPINQSSTQTTELDLNNMKEKRHEEQNIMQLIHRKRKVSIRQDCPLITNIQFIRELGRGAQAEVYQLKLQSCQNQIETIEKRIKQTFLALKRIHLNQKKQNRKSIQLAIHLLIENDCPFLMKGYFFCENSEFIYEGIRLAEGGDLTSFQQTTIGKGDAFRKLGEEGIKMVVAGIVLGLQYLHQHNFIYCDLKTDNVLICSDGYPILADFQLTRSDKTVPAQDFQGTITYVGPQIFMDKTFDKGIDLWALGILIYSLAYNQFPYCKQEVVEGNFVKECRERENKYRLRRKKISQELIDLINKLLKIDSKCRLGYNSLDEIKNHIYFTNFPWKLYEKKQLINPLAQIIKKYPLKRAQLS